MTSMQLGEQTHHACRLNPPVVVAQRTQGKVMTTGRGDHDTNVAAMLTYPPTMPACTCWHWRPQGLPPGESIDTSPFVARDLIDALMKKQEHT
jgi:hypothetical protein